MKVFIPIMLIVVVVILVVVCLVLATSSSTSCSGQLGFPRHRGAGTASCVPQNISGASGATGDIYMMVANVIDGDNDAVVHFDVAAAIAAGDGYTASYVTGMAAPPNDPLYSGVMQDYAGERIIIPGTADLQRGFSTYAIAGSVASEITNIAANDYNTKGCVLYAGKFVISIDGGSNAEYLNISNVDNSTVSTAGSGEPYIFLPDANHNISRIGLLNSSFRYIGINGTSTNSAVYHGLCTLSTKAGVWESYAATTAVIGVDDTSDLIDGNQAFLANDVSTGNSIVGGTIQNIVADTSFEVAIAGSAPDGWTALDDVTVLLGLDAVSDITSKSLLTGTVPTMDLDPCMMGVSSTTLYFTGSTSADKGIYRTTISSSSTSSIGTPATDVYAGAVGCVEGTTNDLIVVQPMRFKGSGSQCYFVDDARTSNTILGWSPAFSKAFWPYSIGTPNVTAGSEGDPEVTTLDGKMYLLPHNEYVYRFIGTHDNGLVVNVRMVMEGGKSYQQVVAIYENGVEKARWRFVDPTGPPKNRLNSPATTTLQDGHLLYTYNDTYHGKIQIKTSNPRALFISVERLRKAAHLDGYVVREAPKAHELRNLRDMSPTNTR